MHHFAYRNGTLFAEDVDLTALAERVGTPFYCYSTATLERHYRVFTDAFVGTPTLLCYSLKANSNQAVIATLGRLGILSVEDQEAAAATSLAASFVPNVSDVPQARVQPAPRVVVEREEA